VKKLSVTISVVVLALVVAGCGSPASSLPSPSLLATASATPAPTPTPPGAITGLLQFPSDFIPPLTVYAISLTDQRVFFSVETPRYPIPMSVTVIPPTYTISGVPPGTYNVFAYRNDDLTYDRGGPGLYSQYLLKCVPPTATSICSDHSLLPVLVKTGQTVAGIDVIDWYYDAQKTAFPPRP
jgi:hypothetical protein